MEDETGISESSRMTYGGFLSPKSFCHSGHASLKFTVSRRELSSQADASSTKEQDDLEDGFSELETPAGDGNENLLISDTDLSDDNEDGKEPHNELELSDTEVEPSEKKLYRGRAQSELFKLILGAPGISVHSMMDKWVEEGKELSRQVISLAMVNLRRRKMYAKALQVIDSNLYLLPIYTI